MSEETVVCLLNLQDREPIRKGTDLNGLLWHSCVIHHLGKVTVSHAQWLTYPYNSSLRHDTKSIFAKQCSSKRRFFRLRFRSWLKGRRFQEDSNAVENGDGRMYSIEQMPIADH